jgi:hypothetical protein
VDSGFRRNDGFFSCGQHYCARRTQSAHRAAGRKKYRRHSGESRNPRGLIRRISCIEPSKAKRPDHILVGAFAGILA